LIGLDRAGRDTSQEGIEEKNRTIADGTADLEKGLCLIPSALNLTPISLIDDRDKII